MLFVENFSESQYDCLLKMQSHMYLILNLHIFQINNFVMEN